MQKLKDMLGDKKKVATISFFFLVGYVILMFILKKTLTDAVSILSAVVTIATAVITYMAWSNTQKLIEARKMEKINANKGDIIVAISLDFQKTNVEQSIISSQLPELEEIINKGEPIEIGSSGDLIPTNKYIQLTKTKTIKRGLLISGSVMPCSNESELNEYIDEFRLSSKKVHDIASKGQCPNIHLFIAGPVELSGLFVPYFVNKMNVLTYHWDSKSHKYCYLGPIDNRDFN